MATTYTYKREDIGDRNTRERFTAKATGAAITLVAGNGNSRATLDATQVEHTAAPDVRPRTLRSVSIHASTAATCTATVTRISGVGAEFDTVLRSIVLAANADAVYYPESDDESMLGDDVIQVTVTSPGGVIVIGVTVFMEIDKSI